MIADLHQDLMHDGTVEIPDAMKQKPDALVQLGEKEKRGFDQGLGLPW